MHARWPAGAAHVPGPEVRCDVCYEPFLSFPRTRALFRLPCAQRHAVCDGCVAETLTRVGGRSLCICS